MKKNANFTIFRRVLVGIMLAQRHRRWPNIISRLGQCIWVVAFLVAGVWDCHPYSNCRNVTYIQKAGLLLSHRQTRWINIEATLVSRPVIAVDAGVEDSCVWSVLEWCWASVVRNWPALNQQWAATLAHHWTEIGWVGLYRVHRRDTRTTIHWQVSNGCWQEPAMVVEWINVEDI